MEIVLCNLICNSMIASVKLHADTSQNICKINKQETYLDLCYET